MRIKWQSFRTWHTFHDYVTAQAAVQRIVVWTLARVVLCKSEYHASPVTGCCGFCETFKVPSRFVITSTLPQNESIRIRIAYKKHIFNRAYIRTTCGAKLIANISLYTAMLINYVPTFLRFQRNGNSSSVLHLMLVANNDLCRSEQMPTNTQQKTDRNRLSTH